MIALTARRPQLNWTLYAVTKHEVTQMAPDKKAAETERFLITERNFYSRFGIIKNCHYTLITLTYVYYEQHYVNAFLLFNA